MIYIEEFANLSSKETGKYMQHLFEKLNLIRLAGTTAKNSFPREETTTKSSLIEDKGIIYGYQTSSESEDDTENNSQVTQTIFHRHLKQSKEPLTG